ncbi:hypothetical protein C7B76_27630, partial [filamentous cyanobacterium CCP2]
MEIEQAIEVINAALEKHCSRSMMSIETVIVKGAWSNQTYAQIAKESGYSISYLMDTGPKFWKLLSQA